jgi:hypothetical protein
LQDLRAILDNGSDLPFPDGLIINGHGSNAYTFTVDQGIADVADFFILKANVSNQILTCLSAFFDTNN